LNVCNTVAMHGGITLAAAYRPVSLRGWSLVLASNGYFAPLHPMASAQGGDRPATAYEAVIKGLIANAKAGPVDIVIFPPLPA
jgi:hypothetical protein